MPQSRRPSQQISQGNPGHRVEAKALVDHFQRNLPLTDRPFAEMAERLGTTEQAVIDLCGEMIDSGVVDRVGPVIAPNVVGASTLVALVVPTDRLESVAAFISGLEEVNHNYRRDHSYNLWFVLVAPTRDALDDVLARIQDATGLDPLDLPLETAYHIDLGFPVKWN